MNAHSLYWNDIQPSDTRETEIQDWMIDNDLTLTELLPAPVGSHGMKILQTTHTVEDY